MCLKEEIHRIAALKSWNHSDAKKRWDCKRCLPRGFWRHSLARFLRGNVVHSISLLSLLRAWAFGWALCLLLDLRLIKTRQHVLFPLSLEFPTELLGSFRLLLITVKATIVEGYVLVVVIVLAFSGYRLALLLAARLIWTLIGLMSLTLTFYDVVRINVTVCALVCRLLRLLLGLRLRRISLWIGLFLVLEELFFFFEEELISMRVTAAKTERLHIVKAYFLPCTLLGLRGCVEQKLSIFLDFSLAPCFDDWAHCLGLSSSRLHARADSGVYTRWLPEKSSVYLRLEGHVELLLLPLYKLARRPIEAASIMGAHCGDFSLFLLRHRRGVSWFWPWEYVPMSWWFRIEQGLLDSGHRHWARFSRTSE